MKQQRLAVYGDEGVAHTLHRLGFDFDEVTEGDLNSGAIAEYDLFLNGSLTWGENLKNNGRTLHDFP